MLVKIKARFCFNQTQHRQGKMKTVIVVSGGDAPGINALIASFSRLAAEQQDAVVGANGGFAGLLAGDILELHPPRTAWLASHSGSQLPSSRQPVLQSTEAQHKLTATLHQHGIDNILLFGGDGTLRHILPLLESWGIACIALPTTIDNDVAGTDYTLGHDSACNYAFQSIDGILSTAHALPGRLFMVETLGGDSGYLALAVAYASAAQIVLLPEYPLPAHWLYARLQSIAARDGYALTVLSEGIPSIPALTAAIPRRTGLRLRYTALGHAQRGAAVSHRDRTAAREMSRIAFQALRGGTRSGAVVSRHGAMTLHHGPLSGKAKPPPDYQRFAFVNQLPITAQPDTSTILCKGGRQTGR